ncbi:hypothetical protein PBRA_003277 [Plasmodiophora brassicae]|uniref:Methionine aminopeptidase n=1 Tax=Plasmodiophora brassicae TaxID=37360 RepID=A0A0G4J7Y8_PLABS|nr:hypothetical protein PBRA_003277 [Plasmodiophora brassicae]
MLRAVPAGIVRPAYAASGVLPRRAATPIVKTAAQIDAMRVAGRIAATMRERAGLMCKPGVTTSEIDGRIHDEICATGAYPSPLNYAGFPKSICTSVNDVMCHGIPDQTRLSSGDIVSIDVSVFHNGVHGDCCATFPVGKVSTEAADVMRAARDACWEAIGICRPGVRTSDIGVLIDEFAAKRGFAVSETFCGHGVGESLHELPNIVHTKSSREYEDAVMEPGMVFTIEPILVVGPDAEHVIMPDLWTAKSQRGFISAQHEEMVAITEAGCEVLTAIQTPTYS